MVNEVTPRAGTPLGGDAVTITGGIFDATTTVTFGASAAKQVRLVSDRELIAVTPPGTGTVDVHIGGAGSQPSIPVPSFTYSNLAVEVVRPDDLFFARFEFVNLGFDAGTLHKMDSSAAAYVIIHLTPQHLDEATFNEVGNTLSLREPPVSTALAGQSRLVFEVPDQANPLRVDLPTLLNWAALRATPLSNSSGNPTDLQTSIELPFRMYLGVDPAAGWTHQPATTPMIDPTTGVAEVWRVSVTGSMQGRVLWSPDLATKPADRSPESDTRARLATPVSGAPPAVTMSGLTLSTVGAWVELEASRPDQGIDFWQRRIEQGRDVDILQVRPGFLGPYGFRVQEIEVIERRPALSPSGAPVEVLVSWRVLQIGQAEVDIPAGSAMPFTQVSLGRLKVTPKLDPLPDTPAMVTLNNQPYLFHLQATDHDGRVVHLDTPLYWVPAPAIGSLGAAKIISGYAGSNRQATLSGESVAFVPSTPGRGARQLSSAQTANGATLVTTAMTMALESAATAAGGWPFRPALERAVVTLPALDRLSDATRTWAIKYHDTYLQNLASGAPTPGQVFATVLDQANVALKAERAGGLMQPVLPVQALSSTLGPVAEDVVKGSFDPASIFKNLGQARLLGGITLKDVLDVVVGVDESAANGLSRLPALTHERLPDAVHTSFRWSPKLKTNVALGALGELKTDRATLSLVVDVTAPLAPNVEPQFSVDGTLTNISLSLLGAIQLDIDLLKFHAEADRKVDLTTGSNVALYFTGDLAFLNVLAKALPADGFADPPYVNADASGVTAGYTVGLPAIGVGVFSVENIAFAAALSLPFDGPLGLKLAFAEEKHPFLVSFSFIGGGGSFGVELDTQRVNSIAGSLALGGNLSVSLGVVGANVHVLAGFYFGLTQQATTFSAFLRIGGSVDVLGLISVSIEACLALTYTSDRNAVAGSAEVTLSAHLLFTTQSITVRAHREFAVPGTSPTPHAALRAAGTAAVHPVGFTDVMDHLTVWQAYWQAFA